VVAIDNEMNLLADTDGAGNVVVAYTYNDPNDLYGPDTVTDGNGHVWRFVHDQWGNVHKMTDPRSTVTNYTWGYPAGSVPTVVNSVAASTSFPMGELMSVKEGTKSPTTFAYYEPSGLAQTVTYPAPGTSGSSSTVSESYTYNTYGEPLTITQPNNNATTNGITTTLTYYTNSGAAYLKGQVATITDNLGDVSGFSYDVRGNVAQAVDAQGNATSYSYNILDQPTQATLPATQMTGSGHGYTSYTYAYLGGPVLSAAQYNESNSQVASTTYSYDQEGNTLSVTGTQPSVSYTYDAAYRLTSIKDGNNHVTSYSYNTAGYLKQVVYPGVPGSSPYAAGTADTTTYTSYDNDGNPLTRVDGKNITTTYTYNDPESLLTGISYNDGHTSRVGISYDSYGRAYQVADGGGTTTYSFDDNDGVTNKAVSFSGGPNASLSYSYYPDGSLASVSIPTVGAFQYTYDGAQRLTGMTNLQGQATHYKYLKNDWLSGQTDYFGSASATSGLIIGYTYDALGQPTVIANDKFINNAGTYSPTYNNITYNGLGQVTGFTNANTGATNTYSYDSFNRLHTEAASGGISGTNYSNSYVSDNANNLTTVRNTSGITFNADSQRTNTPFAFDGNGNMVVPGGGQPVTYDAENRMTNFNNAQETNGYFSDGLRAWNNTSSGKVFFLYDDGVPVVELNSSGSVTATNTFGPSGLVSRTAGGSTNWYTFDPQGNTALIYQSVFNFSNPYVTDAYGNLVSGTSAVPFDGFGAQYGNYHDPITGWYLMGHRFYAPGQGRFVNRDPIGYDGGINLYGYADNDPMNLIDPSGFDVQQVNQFIYGYMGGTANNTFGGVSGTIGNIQGAIAFYKLAGQIGFGPAYAATVHAQLQGMVQGYTAIFHPSDCYVAAGQSLANWDFTVGGMVLGGMALGGGAGGAPKPVTITHWDTPDVIAAMKAAGTMKPGVFVIKGGPSFGNYLRSGIAGKYPFGSSFTTQVPPSNLVWPRFPEWLNGLTLGHRIYRP
jgi:RHS repeat-associated protein